MNNVFVFFLVATLLSFFPAGCASKPDPRETEFPKVVIAPPPVSPVNTGPSEKTLFNGKDLSGWKKTDFGGHGEISVQDGEIRIEMGAELTGINWTNAEVLPKINYEIELDAMKRQGSDFFCGLTIPFSNSFCSFIVGGWGGGVVGISSVNGADASENDTSRNLFFEPKRWYHLRVRVTPQKIMAWIDEDNVVDLEIAGRRISMRGGEIEESKPLGIATWQTSTAIKNIKLKTF